MSPDTTLVNEATVELLLTLQDGLIRDLVAEVGPAVAGRIASSVCDRLSRTMAVSPLVPLEDDLVSQWLGRTLQGLLRR